MNVGRTYHEDESRLQAADWVVRLQADELEADEALTFDAWLQASPENARAYDQALDVWLELGQAAAHVDAGLRVRSPIKPAFRRFYLAAGAIAAAAAAALVVLPQVTPPPAPRGYDTATGEHRTVRLADGSTIELNAGTHLTVEVSAHERRVVLDQGQAVFDVAHDPKRPFLIAAGDRTVRVVGTQFDVRRRDGQLSVTVARGLVEVRPDGGAAGTAFRLHPGQRLDHREGAKDARITAATPEEVLGWRSGRLVYRDQPLAEVVADLNQQFPTPIVIEDPKLGATPISGVLVLDDQDAVIRRLALLVSVTAVRSDAGVVLRRDGAPRP
ncbi:MAG: transcriptional regulator [Caulobacteraceae bacterium]|nr:transcriptional regulator [Caulobacteraceae bacterium]